MYQGREEGLYHPAFLFDEFFFNYISSCVEHLKFEHVLKIAIEFPSSQFHGIIKG